MNDKQRTTTAVVLVGQNKPLIMEEVAIPQLGRGQVLVKILSTGVCRTQIGEWRGVKGEDRFLPHLLGHEAAGLVEEVGPGVTKVKEGDYAVLSWIKGSGIDAPKSEYRGLHHLKGQRINAGAITTFAGSAVISENRMTPIAKEVPPEIAALLGCAVATGAGMVKNTLQARPGEIIGVFGCGGIGLSAILYAAGMGCKVIAVDLVDEKLVMAKDFGAWQMIKVDGRTDRDGPRDHDALVAAVVKDVKGFTGGKGVDHAIESSGAKAMMEAAFESVKDGGLAVLAGNVRRGERILIDPYGLLQHKRIMHTWGGETNPDIDIPYYADLYLKGRLDLKKLITHTFTLDQINEAFLDVEAGKVGRALIKRGD